MNRHVSVTVLLTVFNGEKFLKEAIESILGQSLQDFEFIIINDGSTDSSEEIIKSFADKRIRYVYQKNQGLISSLNKGIKLAKSDIIARMDSDDIAHPDRLRTQLEFLRQHPDHVLVGSNLQFINDLGQITLESPMLLNDPELRLEMLVRCPFGHPAVMYRKEAVLEAGMYDPDFKSAEDYDLWARIVKRGKVANYNSPLLQYRITDTSISALSGDEQAKNTSTLLNNIWRDQAALPRIPRFSTIAKHYTTDSTTTKIQKGRLADVYLAVFLISLRRRYFRYSGSLLTAMVSSPVGVWQLLKSIKRKAYHS